MGGLGIAPASRPPGWAASAPPSERQPAGPIETLLQHAAAPGGLLGAQPAAIGRHTQQVDGDWSGQTSRAAAQQSTAAEGQWQAPPLDGGHQDQGPPESAFQVSVSVDTGADAQARGRPPARRRSARRPAPSPHDGGASASNKRHAAPGHGPLRHMEHGSSYGGGGGGGGALGAGHGALDGPMFSSHDSEGRIGKMLDASQGRMLLATEIRALLLVDDTMPERPATNTPDWAIYRECPKQRRRARNSDRWANSGGVKGSRDLPYNSNSPYVRRRYGSIKDGSVAEPGMEGKRYAARLESCVSWGPGLCFHLSLAVTPAISFTPSNTQLTVSCADPQILRVHAVEHGRGWYPDGGQDKDTLPHPPEPGRDRSRASCVSRGCCQASSRGQFSRI